MPVVSIDLAYRDYRDFGMVVLEDGPSGARYEPFAKNSAQAPTPQQVAEFVIDVCGRIGASLVILDGPQGWKDPSNGLVHSRVCERFVNAPAKSGLPGVVKPANYLGFVEFAIQVFDAFHARGWQRYEPADWQRDQLYVLESLPLRAWRSLGLPYLPAKKMATNGQIESHLQRLIGLGLITEGGLTPTHDQLQAIVAGLGGLAVVANARNRYEAKGTKPFNLGAAWREGYIVSPVFNAPAK